MSEQNIIKLEQTPVITHKLQEVGLKVTNRINELNLANQVATEDTIATLKSMRADLNREAKEFEAQRKMIKDAVMNPYNDFESIYKTEIIEKYKEADNLLKTSISNFELKVKHEKREKLIAYFEEIRDIEQLDWLTFDRLGIDVNLSTSEKKYKEQILAEVQRIVSDLDFIATDQYSAEILVEYKKTLLATRSISEVRLRKDAEKLEATRLRDDRTRKRQSQLRNLTFIYQEFTATHNWIKDQSVMISLSDVENLSEDEWIKRYVEFQNIVAKGKPKESVSAPLSAPVLESPTEQAPKEEKGEDLFEAKFSVKATYKELNRLGDFLKENNYNYQNID